MTEQPGWLTVRACSAYLTVTLSTEVTGGCTGRVIGMYVAAGTVRFNWFDYETLQDEPPG